MQGGDTVVVLLLVDHINQEGDLPPFVALLARTEETQRQERNSQQSGSKSSHLLNFSSSLKWTSSMVKIKTASRVHSALTRGAENLMWKCESTSVKEVQVLLYSEMPTVLRLDGRPSWLPANQAAFAQEVDRNLLILTTKR